MLSAVVDDMKHLISFTALDHHCCWMGANVASL